MTTNCTLFLALCLSRLPVSLLSLFLPIKDLYNCSHNTIQHVQCKTGQRERLLCRGSVRGSGGREEKEEVVMMATSVRQKPLEEEIQWKGTPGATRLTCRTPRPCHEPALRRTRGKVLSAILLSFPMRQKPARRGLCERKTHTCRTTESGDPDSERLIAFVTNCLTCDSRLSLTRTRHTNDWEAEIRKADSLLTATKRCTASDLLMMR